MIHFIAKFLEPYAFSASIRGFASALKEKGFNNNELIDAGAEMAKLCYKGCPKYVTGHLAYQLGKNTQEFFPIPGENYDEPTFFSSAVTEAYAVALYYIFKRGVPGTAAYYYSQATVEPFFRKMQYLNYKYHIYRKSV